MTQAYRSDPPAHPVDLLLLAEFPRDPEFDPVLTDFLMESDRVARERSRQPGTLLHVQSLGRKVPWLYRLTFRTRGRVRGQLGDAVGTRDEHVFTLRFLPDYLRRADKFEMLRYVGPPGPHPWHPNIAWPPLAESLGAGDALRMLPPPGLVCVRIDQGQTLLEICAALHDLLRWRLRAYDDPLNPLAAAWGRETDAAPVDDRPLFGRRISLHIQPLENRS